MRDRNCRGHASRTLVSARLVATVDGQSWTRDDADGDGGDDVHYYDENTDHHEGDHDGNEDENGIEMLTTMTMSSTTLR